MAHKFQSKLLQKKALDALLEGINDPEYAQNQHHSDPDYTTQNGKLYGKGTEFEDGIPVLADALQGEVMPKRTGNWKLWIFKKSDVQFGQFGEVKRPIPPSTRMYYVGDKKKAIDIINEEYGPLTPAQEDQILSRGALDIADVVIRVTNVDFTKPLVLPQRKHLQGTAKPKCPHCGSSDYGLMPTDFETAKCNNCGKNWNHGIVKGINDPEEASAKTAADVWLYHGTSNAALKEILKQGRVKGISHWGSFGVAKNWAQDIRQGGAVIGVPLSRFNPDHLSPDEEAREGLLVPKDYDDAYEEWSGSAKTWKDSLRIYEAVEYDLDLPVTETDVVSADHFDDTDFNTIASKTAAANVPDSGTYDEKHEAHVREEAKDWAQYAEESDNTDDIKPFDPAGDYLCGTCDMRQGKDECLRVDGKIKFDCGSCRLYHKGEPETEPPMKHKFTKEDAKYTERPHVKGFGCHRCEYGGEAKQADSEGRASWCSFWGMHIVPNACCAENEGDDDVTFTDNLEKAANTQSYGTGTPLGGTPNQPQNEEDEDEEDKTASAKTATNFPVLPFDKWLETDGREFAHGMEAEPDKYDRQQLEWRYDENVSHFSTIDFPLTVYRALEIEKGSPINVDHAGVCWTWVENSADAYFGSTSMWAPGGTPEVTKPQLVILKAQVQSAADVNWKQTLHANMVNEEENEVTVWEGHTLKLLAIDYGKGYQMPPRTQITAAVEMHETPKSLPPRDDIRRHIDQDAQEEVMEGVMDGVSEPTHKPKPKQIPGNLPITAASAVMTFPVFDSWWDKVKRIPRALEHVTFEWADGLGVGNKSLAVKYDGKFVGQIGFSFEQLERVLGGALSKLIPEQEDDETFNQIQNRYRISASGDAGYTLLMKANSCPRCRSPKIKTGAATNECLACGSFFHYSTT